MEIKNKKIKLKKLNNVILPVKVSDLSPAEFIYIAEYARQMNDWYVKIANEITKNNTN